MYIQYNVIRNIKILGMSAKYNIGNILFKTKKSCYIYAKNIIDNIGVSIINKEHAQYSFFINLLNNHPECNTKIGVGINYFYIVRDTYNKKAYKTMIKRTDNTEIDFSWKYCCEFKKRSILYDLNNAMRSAVRDYTFKYKCNNKLICKYCNIKNANSYHVDHEKPSFNTLKNNFLKNTNKQIPSSFDELPKLNLTIFSANDKDFENEWVMYHNTNCNLQILCESCNLTKSKKDKIDIL